MIELNEAMSGIWNGVLKKLMTTQKFLLIN